jgi:hypothetical protein
MVFLRDDVSLQKLKQQHKSADDDLVDYEHSALEFNVSLGKSDGFDVEFVSFEKKKNGNNNDEMEWWVTRCICHVENTGETIVVSLEDSATIAMLKMKLRAELNKNTNKKSSSSTTSAHFTGATTTSTMSKNNTNTPSTSLKTLKKTMNGMNGKNGERNGNETKRIILGGGVPSSAGKNTTTMGANRDGNKDVETFRGLDDDDDDRKYDDLGRKVSKNNYQQQQEKNITTNKTNENVFLRDLSEFANELVEVVAPKPKELPSNSDKTVASNSGSKNNDISSNNNKKDEVLETMGSWEKVDEWQAWGEIGEVQVKHRTSPAPIQTPNVTVNVKKVERGKTESMKKKLNATKVPHLRKEKNLSSFALLSFVSNIQDSFANMAATSTKYSVMVAELVPGFAAHSLSAHIMIFVTVAAILVKLMGFTFWLLCVVLVCYARVRSEENLRALAEKKALDLQSKLAKVQDDLEQLQFAAATVAANTASRGGSLSSGSASVLNNGQSVADVLWINSTIAACWDGFLRNWLSSLAGNLLSDKLSTAKPSVLDSIHLASFEMNHKPPSCRNVKVLRSRKVFEGVMLELGVELSDISFNMTIHSKLAQLKIPLKLAVELDATNLLLRSSVLLINKPPYAGLLKTSFADLPETKLKIIPEGVSGRIGNIAEFPGIDVWIKNSIQDALVENLLEPNSYTWNIEEFFQVYYK